MAEAVYHNNTRDLFSEVRKMNTGKRLMVRLKMMIFVNVLVISLINCTIVYHMMLIYFRRLRIKLIQAY